MKMNKTGEKSFKIKDVEISQLDTRHEGARLKDRNREKEILSSMIEGGVKEPLQCVEKPDGRMILLDGFKRLRCSLKLGIKVIPVISLGSDEPTAILRLLRLSNTKGLSILEQSALVDELNKAHGMGVSEIARRLERSPAWVSVRLGVIGEMSPVVKKAVFGGRFSARSYLYTLRHFTRVNKTKKTDIDTFVKIVSGKRLSTRSIEVLAEGFFNGPPNLKEQILQGNIDWTLNQLRIGTQRNNFNNEQESGTLRDLELAQRCMGKIPYKLKRYGLLNPSFFTEARLLIESILGRIDSFKIALKEFYDKRG